VAALKTANKLRSNIIHPGQDLMVTAAPKGMKLPASAALAAETSSRGQSHAGKHVVRRGDTLWSIARRHGVSMDRLARTNGINSTDTLSIGQVLSIPGTTRLASA